MNEQELIKIVEGQQDLISKLSDDIGTMADRILEMADKIDDMADKIVHVIEISEANIQG